MRVEAVIAKESKEQKVMSFIEGMKAIKFEGPRGKFNLDTFLLLTYNQKTREDEIEFVSWAVDSSRSDFGYIKTLLNLLELPKKKNHPPYPRKEAIPYEEKRIPVIAFGTGPTGRSFLYRRKEMSTKISFERLKEAVGL